jgi:hypothetical protein
VLSIDIVFSATVGIFKYKDVKSVLSFHNNKVYTINNALNGFIHPDYLGLATEIKVL